MAITITGIPANDELIAGFNPFFIEFETDVVPTPVRAELSIGVPWLSQTIVIEVTPSNNNIFKFNYQSVVRDLVRESDKYLETQYTYPDISTLSNALFVDDNISTLLSLTIVIYDSTGAIIDNTTVPSGQDMYFLKASRQVLESPVMSDYSSTVGIGGGFENFLNSSSTVKVWEGFPIDVQFDALDSTLQTIQLNGVLFNSAITCDLENRMLRLVLIDALGNELTGLNDNTNNNIEVNLNPSIIDVFISVNYNAVSCPEDSKYIRWKNLNGGESFWLFEDVYTIEKQRRNKKRINRNHTDLETARSRNLSLGNDTTEIMIVSQITTEQFENDILHSLISSPVIELYEGDNKWRRIELISHDGVDSSKETNTNFRFNFDIGTLYNQAI